MSLSIPFPSIQPYNLSTLPSIPLVLSQNTSFSDPQQVYLSFSLCSPLDTLPDIFISNNSAAPIPSSSNLTKSTDGWKSNASKGVWWVSTTEGYANWTGWWSEGLYVAVWTNENTDGSVGAGEIEVGISASGTPYTQASTLPVLGDTTNLHALIYTPPFMPVSTSPETQVYPNYTIPPPNFSPTEPTTTPNHTLYILPTSSFNVSSGLSASLCFVRKTFEDVGVKGLVEDRQVVLNATQDGWRERIVLSSSGETGAGELKAGVNYTMWSFIDNSTSVGVEGSGELSGPVMFQMKQDDFPCPLVHSIDLCPTINYAAALPFPDDSLEAGIVTSLPSNMNETLSEMLSNFAATLNTFACGRDMYSLVSSCEDCYTVYRNWLCGSLIPRCGESPLTETFGPPFLIERTPANPRINSSIVTPPSYTFQELLPCLETCTIVDRICPVFLGFRCPITTGGTTGNGTARLSYGVGGVGGIDMSVKLDGLLPGELGDSSNRYGDRRCALWEGWTA